MKEKEGINMLSMVSTSNKKISTLLKDFTRHPREFESYSKHCRNILNSFVFSICSLAVGFLIGTITHNKQAIGGIVNVVALGTSFLCGCFVPASFMPSYVLKIAHILPTYYFVQNNELIKTLEYFKLETLQPIIINGIIVLGFTLSFVLITLMISKRKQKIG